MQTALDVVRHGSASSQAPSSASSAAPRQFPCGYRYVDRRTKAKYVWLKYAPILREASILDVGSDQCHLKEYLDEQATYWGIGLGGSPDQQVDLEQGKLPFEDGSYDCVLCLDVLEHLESIHRIFDELCRVSRRYVILSLPSPWACFWRFLRKGAGQPGRSDHPLKFYGLPLERPQDRHRWFFSEAEARAFVQYRAEKCGMKLVQLDNESDARPRARWVTRLRRWVQTLWLHRCLDRRSLYAGTLWALLEKNQPVEEEEGRPPTSQGDKVNDEG